MPLLTRGEQEGCPSRIPKPFVLAVFLLGGAFLVSGCSAGATSCTSDSDCSGSDACTNGVCTTADGGQQDDGGFTAQTCFTIPSLVNGGTVGPATEPTTCTTSGRLSAAPAGTVTDLGSFIVGTKVNFSVPPQTFSFTLVSQAVSAVENLTLWEEQADGGSAAFPLANNVFPDLITNPAGNDWWNYQTANDPSSTTPLEGLPIYNPISPDAPVISSLRLPNTTALLQADAADGGLPKGTWSFVLADYAELCLTTQGCDGGTAADRYDVQLITRTGGVPLQGTLNIDVYLLTSDGLTHSSAPSNMLVQRMINTLAAIYAPSGVCIGTVTFYDLPAWAKDRFGTVLNTDDTSPCSDLSQLYTLSQQNRNTIPIFLVDQLTTSETDGSGNPLTVLGKDGTIPGPTSYGSTISSGAVVTAADLMSSTCAGSRNFATCGADRVGYYAAHEIGHYLGLYHTTEAAGTTFDPLSDTPQCQCDQCISANSPTLCADEGGTAPGETPASVSPAPVQQQRGGLALLGSAESDVLVHRPQSCRG